MKKLDQGTAERISDLINDLELSISDYALEKDFMVSEALGALASMRSEEFDLIFCGGTCLSKAYGILERFSEDIDIKVVTKPGFRFSSRSQQKVALSRLKSKVLDTLADAGFDRIQIDRDKTAWG